MTYHQLKDFARKYGGEEDEIRCGLVACLNCGMENSIERMVVDSEGTFCNENCQNEFYEREEE